MVDGLLFFFCTSSSPSVSHHSPVRIHLDVQYHLPPGAAMSEHSDSVSLTEMAFDLKLKNK